MALLFAKNNSLSLVTALPASISGGGNLDDGSISLYGFSE